MKILNIIFSIYLCCLFFAFTHDMNKNNKMECDIHGQKDPGKENILPNNLDKTNMACSVEFTGIGNIHCDGEVIDYSIYFDSNEFGANGYYLIRNGFTSGPYFTMDSIHWGDISYCQEEEMLIIYDADEPTCRDTFIWETPCCPCEFEFVVDQFGCEEGLFNISGYFFASSGSCLPYWESAVLTVNGVPHDFNNQGGGEFTIYGLISDLEFNTYRLTFTQPLGEYKEVVLLNECPNTCLVNDFSVTFDSMSCSGEFALLNFDFESYIFGRNGYTLTTNYGHVFNFESNSNRNFEIIADCNYDYTFYIMDNDYSDCIDSVHFGQICCPCLGTYSEFEKSPCQNNSFNTVHVFDYQSGSCFSQDWSLTQNGIPKEFNWFNNNYLEINDVTLPDSLITYELCWEGNLSACFSLTQTNPCFVSPNQCYITFEESSPPVCSNDSVHISLRLYGENISLQGYDVYVNDSFLVWLNYRQDSSYVLSLLDPGTENFALKICNNLNPNCCAERIVSNPCYNPMPDCAITFDHVSGPVCDSNEVVMQIHLEALNHTMTGFDVYVNDSLFTFLTEDPTNLYTLQFNSPDTSHFNLRICDHGDAGCCDQRMYENPCFQGDNCSLVFEETSNLVCDSNYIHFSVLLFGEYLSQSGFNVYLDSSTLTFMPFAADSVYALEIPDNGRPFFNVTICDDAYAQCCYTQEYANPCYEPNIDCNLEFESLTAPICGGNGVSMSVMVHGENHGLQEYDLYLDGIQFGQIPFEADSTYTITVPNNGQINYHLTICAGDHSTCCQEKVFLNPCYSVPDTCDIFLENVVETVCDSGLISMSIHVVSQHTSGTGYDILVDDSLVLSVPFSSDSIYSITFTAPESGEFILTVCDRENSACCRGILVINACAPQGLCRLNQLESQVSRSGTDSMQLDIQYSVKGVCAPSHKATLWVDLNAPVDFTIYEQMIEHSFQRIDADPIIGKLCFSEPFDTCVTMVLVNPFTSGSENIINDKIHVFSVGNLIMVHNPSGEEYQYICSDLLGRQLLTGTSAEPEQIYRLNTPNLSGVYLFTVHENKQWQTYKLLLSQD